MPLTYYRGMARPVMMKCRSCNKEFALTPKWALTGTNCKFCGRGLSVVKEENWQKEYNKSRYFKKKQSVKKAKLDHDITRKIHKEWLKKSSKMYITRNQAARIAKKKLTNKSIQSINHKNIPQLMENAPVLSNNWTIISGHIFWTPFLSRLKKMKFVYNQSINNWEEYANLDLSKNTNDIRGLIASIITHSGNKHNEIKDILILSIINKIRTDILINFFGHKDFLSLFESFGPPFTIVYYSKNDNLFSLSFTDNQDTATNIPLKIHQEWLLNTKFNKLDCGVAAIKARNILKIKSLSNSKYHNIDGLLKAYSYLAEHWKRKANILTRK